MVRAALAGQGRPGAGRAGPAGRAGRRHGPGRPGRRLGLRLVDHRLDGRPGRRAGRRRPVGAGRRPRPGPGAAGDRRVAAVLPLAGIGPALFLHALVWQNLGWQAVLGGRSQGQAFLLVMVGNLAALAAGTAAALAREVRWPVVGTALAGLAVAVALGERGHGRRRPSSARRPPPSCWWPSSAGPPAGGRRPAGRPGWGRLGRLDGRHGAVRAAGVRLLRRLRRGPAGRQRAAPGAGGRPGRAGRRRVDAGSRPGGPGRRPAARARDLVPVGVGVALLAGPAGFLGDGARPGRGRRPGRARPGRCG